MPLSPDDAIRKAEALARRGETQQARQLFQALLENNPADARASEGLAALDQRSAQFQALSELYRNGDLARVAEDGERLARQYPDAAFVHNILGNAYTALRRFEAAIQSYATALRLKPGIAEVHVNLGKAFSQMDRLTEAISCFRNAARIRPNYADAHYSLGVALHMEKHDEEAIAAYRKAIAIRPDFAEAYDNLGIALRRLGHFDEAAACFRQELTLRPDHAGTYVHLGIALGKAGRLPDSNAAFTAALALQSNLADTHGQKLFQAATICDWATLSAEAEMIASLGLEGPAVRPFVMLPLEDAPLRHRVRAERFTRERFLLPGLGPIAPPAEKPARIKIGYFSANFHNHAVMYLMARVLELHDRSRFEVHAYSHGPAASDEMRQRARHAVEFFHDVQGSGSREIAERARTHGIAIAIDLMGHTENSRPEIFAHRAAPIQIAYLGYPGTLGGSLMDYIVADKILVPAGCEDHYSEKIIRLPHSYMASDNKREISQRAMSRQENGLPEQGVVFCCFNNIYKIGAGEFGIWLRLLEQVEGSVLWLSGTNPWARTNLKAEAEKQKLDPARIIFTNRVPMAEHLARHRLADLFLDSFHYNAHSTASDALWAGLPLVTLAGQGFPARVAASLLSAIGLDELITHSAEEYERLALNLARDPQRLAALKTKLAGLRSNAPLFGSEAFTRHLEDGYALAYRRYFDGKPPDHIQVIE